MNRSGRPEWPHNVPAGIVGDLRILAAVVQAALSRVGYREVPFLNENKPGLSIGCDGTVIVVANLEKPQDFSPTDAEHCARALNQELGKLARSAGNLATVRRGTVHGYGSYTEVAVSSPKGMTLRALRRSLAR